MILKLLLAEPLELTSTCIFIVPFAGMGQIFTELVPAMFTVFITE